MPPSSSDRMPLSPRQAQAMQDDTRERDVSLMWFVMLSDLEHPGKFIARAHTADPDGGTWLPGALIASTLEGLRTMLPCGLTRRERTSVMARKVIETWD